MRMPTSCAEGTSLSRANSWEAANVFSEKTWAMTPTAARSCPSPRRPRARWARREITRGSGLPARDHHAEVRPRGAALKRAEVILPLALGPNLAGAQRACSAPQADASNCPESSRVGTAIIDSPLQPEPVSGPVYIAFNTAEPDGPAGPDGDPAAAGGCAARRRSRGRHIRHDEHVRVEPGPAGESFTLQFEGGQPDSALVLTQDLCGDKTDRTMEVHLVAHNGKESFEQELATPGCDPRASFSLRRKGRRATLVVARLRATRVGPGITQFGLRLPKTLTPRQDPPLRARRRQALAPGHPQAAGDDAVPGRGPLSDGRWRGLERAAACAAPPWCA